MTRYDRRNGIGLELLSVQRPGRYLGGELNARKHSPERAYRFGLLFPDLYDIGISYHGFQILYHLLNRFPEVVCERAYLPAPDMQSLMRRRRIPLYTLESGATVGGFNVVGITLQTEMHYPGVVRALDSAGITRLTADRRDDEPIVIGGGPCAFHPEPVAPFFDAFLIGDGEEAVGELVGLLKSDAFRRVPRRAKWEALAGLSGVYVPALYTPAVDEPVAVRPMNGAPSRIRARVTPLLKPDHYPTHPIVPILRGVHDRLTVEIMRGCTQGCRFCQAGMLHRPVRERPVSDIVEQVLTGLEATGYNEVGLLSLSTSDYSRLTELLTVLSEELAHQHASLAFPSLRPASFTEETARIDAGGRKSGLTFAVEAGSQRLRDVINKSLTEDELLTAVERGYRHGWRSIKLYFMVGLPTETDDDLGEGSALLQRVEKLVPRGRELHISVAPFIPKPHTVFEGERFVDVDDLKTRQQRLCRGVGSRRVKLDFANPERYQIEALLARGDRRLAPVIAAVAESGEGLEAWSDWFSRERWLTALSRHLPDWQRTLEPISDALPRSWGHLAKGVTPKFIRSDRDTANAGRTLPDCRDDESAAADLCGLMKLCDEASGVSKDQPVEPRTTNHGPQTATTEPQTTHRYRLWFAKLRRMRYLGHHDIMRLVELGLRRAGVPLRYREGFSRRPKFSYGPALPLGQGGLCLWLAFETTTPLVAEDWLPRIRWKMPPGLRPWRLETASGMSGEFMFVCPCSAPQGRTGGGKESSQEGYRLKFNTPIPLPTTADGIGKEERTADNSVRSEDLTELSNLNGSLMSRLREIIPTAAACQLSTSRKVLTLTLDDRRALSAKIRELQKVAPDDDSQSENGFRLLSVTRI
jgi:radical SAM family uncharacterized protein